MKGICLRVISYYTSDVQLGSLIRIFFCFLFSVSYSRINYLYLFLIFFLFF